LRLTPGEFRVAKKAIHDALQKVKHTMANTMSSTDDELSSSDDDLSTDEESTGSGAKPGKETRKEQQRKVTLKKGDLVTALMDNQGADLHEAELAFVKVCTFSASSSLRECLRAIRVQGDTIEVVEQLSSLWCAGKLRRDESSVGAVGYFLLGAVLQPIRCAIFCVQKPFLTFVVVLIIADNIILLFTSSRVDKRHSRALSNEGMTSS
jgi:hypothetical protein